METFAEELDPNQVEQRPLVRHVNLAYELARFDINVIPLESDNLFCSSKSPLKYFEAALVNVPTVAVDNPSYRALITPGEDGFLAGGTEAWDSILAQLLESPEWRSSIGTTAKKKCVRMFSIDVLLDKYSALPVRG